MRDKASAHTVRLIESHPLTTHNWDDFLTVMGPKGGDAGCFCMYYRLTGSQFKERSGEPNREAMRQLVGQGVVPGLIGYRDGEPVGWVAVGPRDWYGRLGRSPVSRPVDDRPAWAITCFVVPREHRRTGVASDLLEAAVAYARAQGADVVEGYPVEPRTDRLPDFWSWMGFAAMFEAAGFTEVARRSETRPFMRKELGS